ncbi:hypothetical protein [Ottowia thiooxydans]|uniref:hypothetical protein n=1 Tax=Ottowia thiooxydans TaxID=219182 RepID=UPI00339301FE
MENDGLLGVGGTGAAGTAGAGAGAGAAFLAGAFEGCCFFWVAAGLRELAGFLAAGAADAALAGAVWLWTGEDNNAHSAAAAARAPARELLESLVILRKPAG